MVGDPTLRQTLMMAIALRPTAMEAVRDPEMGALRPRAMEALRPTAMEAVWDPEMGALRPRAMEALRPTAMETQAQAIRPA